MFMKGLFSVPALQWSVDFPEQQDFQFSQFLGNKTSQKSCENSSEGKKKQRYWEGMMEIYSCYNVGGNWFV